MSSDHKGVSTNSEQYQRQKKLLENEYDFPCEYQFKFIVSREKVDDVLTLFPDHTPKLRPSKKGNYVSIGITVKVDSADLILAIYEKAGQIEGLIPL